MAKRISGVTGLGPGSEEISPGPGDGCVKVLEELKSLANPSDAAGMSRFGIRTEKALGVRVPEIRTLAKKAGKDHALALQLWATGIHEARILACLVADPDLLSGEQADRWAGDFDSWDLCDQCCLNLFRKTAFAYEKCIEWSSREEEFVKRAGFALMAVLAVHDREASDEHFEQFFPSIVGGAEDSRNFVKKAVSWALRQIGKRNRTLNGRAIEKARKIQGLDSKSARWVASDVLRELESEAVRKRLQN